MDIMCVHDQCLVWEIKRIHEIVELYSSLSKIKLVSPKCIEKQKDRDVSLFLQHFFYYDENDKLEEQRYAMVGIRCSLHYSIIQFFFFTWNTSLYTGEEDEQKKYNMRSTLRQKENEAQSYIDIRKSKAIIQTT